MLNGLSLSMKLGFPKKKNMRALTANGSRKGSAVSSLPCGVRSLCSIHYRIADYFTL